MKARVLIVEDNDDVALGLRRCLETDGYAVDVAADGVEALDRLAEPVHDLVILDLMLPRLDGFQVLRTLRSRGNDVPVLILSARGQEIDKVQGFRMGADNYAVKPIGVLELLARIDAMLARASRARRSSAAGRDTYRFGSVHVDVRTRTVTRDGDVVALSPKEFDMLHHLLRRDGAVVPRDELLREVWGYKRAVPTRTVDAHVALLRGKLEDSPSQPRFLLTVRKAGYRLDREGGGSPDRG